MFKRVLVASLLAAASLASHAAVTFTPGATDTINIDFDPNGDAGLVWPGGTAPVLQYGVFSIDGPYAVTYTFLGKEASYKDSLTGYDFAIGGQSFDNTVATGTSITVTDLPSLVDFSFTDPSVGGGVVSNGGIFATGATMSWGVLTGATTTKYGPFDYIIGFNDSGEGLRFDATYGPHTDFDDMVIGINFAPIPEPETYALMLAGLAAVGFMARRRKVVQ